MRERIFSIFTIGDIGDRFAIINHFHFVIYYWLRICCAMALCTELCQSQEEYRFTKCWQQTAIPVRLFFYFSFFKYAFAASFVAVCVGHQRKTCLWVQTFKATDFRNCTNLMQISSLYRRQRAHFLFNFKISCVYMKVLGADSHPETLPFFHIHNFFLMFRCETVL